MQDLYDDMISGIAERQAGYAAELTDDWKADSFRADVGRWARAAAAVTRWRSLKVAIFGYAMNDMGDIRVDESALIRSLGPEILAVAPGDMFRGMQAVTDEEVAGVIAAEDGRFEIDPRLSAAEREDHARTQVAIKAILDGRGFGAYTAHFDAIGEDGRFSRLPLAAASTLMAGGYGYAAEGDVLTASPRARTSTAPNSPPWKCPTASSARLPACAPSSTAGSPPAARITRS
jgi:L-arabinose isomerase